MQVERDRQRPPALVGRDERQVGRPDGMCVLDIKFSVRQAGTDREQVALVSRPNESARSFAYKPLRRMRREIRFLDIC
jgi:hypothetical protein